MGKVTEENKSIINITSIKQRTAQSMNHCSSCAHEKILRVLGPTADPYLIHLSVYKKYHWIQRMGLKLNFQKLINSLRDSPMIEVVASTNNVFKLILIVSLRGMLVNKLSISFAITYNNYKHHWYQQYPSQKNKNLKLYMNLLLKEIVLVPKILQYWK